MGRFHRFRKTLQRLIFLSQTIVIHLVMKQKNILEHAQEIIYDRAEESARNYGNFTEGMEKVAQLSTLMCNKEITPEDCYKVLIALKLSRESYNKKYDNILDAISYMAAMYNHFQAEYDKTRK